MARWMNGMEGWSESRHGSCLSSVHLMDNQFRTYTTKKVSTSSSEEVPQKKKRIVKPPKQVLKITERAAERLKYLLSNRPGALGILIGLKKRGCNGLSWTFDYITKDTEIPKLAETIEDKGVRVVIQPGAVMNVIGTEMDYEENEVHAKFVFNNPNAIGTCGCGESFNVSTAANDVSHKKTQKM